MHFNLAPLSTRRDIALLGFLHRVRLGLAPAHLARLFPLDFTDLRRSVRQARHDHRFLVDTSGCQLEIFKRSVFGLTRIYNILPERIVVLSSVSAFQSGLQGIIKRAASENFPHWEALLSPRIPLHVHPLRHID